MKNSNINYDSDNDSSDDEISFNEEEFNNEYNRRRVIVWDCIRISSNITSIENQRLLTQPKFLNLTSGMMKKELVTIFSRYIAWSTKMGR